MSNAFVKDLLKAIQDEDTHLATDDEGAGAFTGWLDSGCYALNALTSGSIYGGLPNNKRTMLAGKSAVGKTFFALGVVKYFLDKHPEGLAIFYDSEAAINGYILKERGLDTSRIIIVDLNTIQEFRTHVLRFVSAYAKQDEKTRPPMMLVLDSLGNLSTTKELADIEKGLETKDLTKSGVIRAAFRAITVPLANVRIPLIITNHTYTNIMAYGAPEALSGGPGVNYCADNIIMLTRAQDKDTQTGPVLGNIITAKNLKSRYTKERAAVKLRLRYDTGLDKYYGLLDIAERGGVVTSVAKKFTLPDGTQAKESAIYKNPEKYFTKEFLDLIDKAASNIFKYGGTIEDKLDVIDDSDEEQFLAE